MADQSSGPDVSQLAQESFADAPFPAPRAQAFRVYFTPDAHAGIAAHAKADTSVEICGVLVGNWKKDDDGPYAEVIDFIRCDNATSKFAEVTFTHDSWSHINNEMDARFNDERILGWYHSHPDFGIFLSEPDVFIHQNFFDSPGQIAYVVDPVRNLEGAFQWIGGKPRPMASYYVGERVVTVDASVSNDRLPARSEAASEPVGVSRQSADRDDGLLDQLLPVLAYLCLFLLGYMFASWGNRTERVRTVEGVAAHYGYNKLLRLGLDDDVQSLQQGLRLTAVATEKMLQTPIPTEDKEAIVADRKIRQQIVSQLRQIDRALEVVQSRYAFDDDEVNALKKLQYVSDRVQSLTTGQVKPSEFDMKPPTPQKTSEEAKQETTDKSKAEPDAKPNAANDAASKTEKPTTAPAN